MIRNKYNYVTGNKSIYFMVYMLCIQISVLYCCCDMLEVDDLINELL